MVHVTKRSLGAYSVIRNTLLTDGRQVVDYQPGNGSRYMLVLTRLEGEESRAVGCAGAPCIVIGLVNFEPNRCMIASHVPYYLYVADKLNLREPDAKAVAELLAKVWPG